jgi:hypothetical protein
MACHSPIRLAKIIRTGASVSLDYPIRLAKIVGTGTLISGELDVRIGLYGIARVCYCNTQRICL